MLIGMLIGMLISAGVFMTIHFWRFYRRKTTQFTEKNIMELVERSKDIMYYFQIEPTMKHRFVSKSVEVDLGEDIQKMLLEDPEFAFRITHPEDLQTVYDKLSDNLDYKKPIRQRFQAYDGRYIWFEEYATPVYKNGRIVAIQGILRNINEKILLEEKLQYQFSHDSLTDVFNRGYFEEKKTYYDQKEELSVGLIVCDLDRLKYVNDFFGHQQGDIYIASAATILKKEVGDCGIVTRIGGDEFAIIAEGISEQALMDLVDQLKHAFDAHNKGLPLDKCLSISIGYAWTSNSKDEMDLLYVAADAAMYENKRRRKAVQMLA